LAECRAQHHDAYAINKSMDAIWKVVADANRYFAGQEPWALKKTDPARMETVLYVTAEVLRIVGLLAQPYVPVSAEKLLDLLAVPEIVNGASRISASLVAGHAAASAPHPSSRATWRRGSPPAKA
jgi:methionyl-tRNA synthetase